MSVEEIVEDSLGPDFIEKKRVDNTISSLNYPYYMRARPVMYMGDTVNSNHALTETVDNVADLISKSLGVTKAFIKSAKTNKKGSHFLVSNDGESFPINYHPEDKRTSMHLAVDKPHSGSNFKGKANSIGQNGIGLKGVNALSEKFIVATIIRKEAIETSSEFVKKNGVPGNYFVIEYHQGVLAHEYVLTFEELKAKYPDVEFPNDYTTHIVSYPDAEIYDSVTARIDKDRLGVTLKIFDKFYNNRDITYILDGEVINYKSAQMANSILQKFMVTSVNEKGKLDEELPQQEVRFLVSFEFTKNMKDLIGTGNINSREVPKGAHVNDSVKALCNALKEVYNIPHNHLAHGIVIEVLVVAPGANLQLVGQTKDSLTRIRGLKDEELTKLTRSLVKYIRKHKDEFEDHVKRLNEYALSLANLASKDYIETMTTLNSKGTRIEIPKLKSAAYSKDREKCTLYITEGDSAATLIIKAMDKEFEGAFIARGYFMNTIGQSLASIFANEEALQLTHTLSCGFGPHFTYDTLMYHNIVLCMDADADGGAIQNLFIGFFCEHLPELVKNGHLFINDSPLYKQGGKYYRASEAHLVDLGKTFKRYKGLGSFTLPEVKSEIVGPNRRLIQVDYDTWEEARALVGSFDGARRQLLVKNDLIIE